MRWYGGMLKRNYCSLCGVFLVGLGVKVGSGDFELILKSSLKICVLWNERKYIMN
jgi:hypothetical protein